MYSSTSALKIPRKSTPMSEILREDGSVRETLLPSSLVQISSLLFEDICNIVMDTNPNTPR